MREDLVTYCRAGLEPAPAMPINDWAAANIDFSLVPNYDTRLKAPYDPDYCYYLRPVMDWLQDYVTREVWLRKCSRAGVSELMLAFLKWVIVVSPRRLMYQSCDMAASERFMIERIKRGFRTCPEAARKYRQAQQVEHDIRFPEMDCRVTWPKSKSAFRQDGWEAIVLDEYSKFPATVVDQARRRCASYPTYKVVGLGSPDEDRTWMRRGETQDPIIAEYDQTDACVWMMPEPGRKRGKFAWEWGGPDEDYGIKWPETAKNKDGEWDLEKVKKGAYYRTPGGAKILEKDRLKVSRQGEWRGTRRGAEGRRGVWIVAPMTPFADVSFGLLAERFLSAKLKSQRGEPNALRSYFANNWASLYVEKHLEAPKESLKQVEANYGAPFVSGGARMPESFDAQQFREDFEKALGIEDSLGGGTKITVDVQKYEKWVNVRWWCVRENDRAATGLVYWRKVLSWEDVDQLVAVFEPGAMGIDIGYQDQAAEVAEYCAETGAIALKGDDKVGSQLNQDLVLHPERDVYEGRRAQAGSTARYDEIVWNSDVFRTRLVSAIRGETPYVWRVYRMPEREYVRQVTSTEKRNGVWDHYNYRHDHLFDDEVMQLVLARYEGLIA